MIPRFFTPPDESFFLFGARGVGKSTILKNKFKNAKILDLLDADLFRQLTANPELLSGMISGNPDIRIWIVDEIQRIPQLLPVVHQWIEKEWQSSSRGMKTGRRQFVLTGSSARKPKTTGVDLLGGRALDCRLYPFTASELGDDFSLDVAISKGMLPLVHHARSYAAKLSGYLSLYMQLEVQAEGLVRSLPNFSRFLISISFSHGSVLNYSDIARDCAIDAKTARNYVEILEDLLLAYRVPVFSKRAKRELIAANKFYYFDAGVYQSIRPKGILDRPEEIAGAAFEGLVYQHLLAWSSYRGRGDQVYFWRSRGGVEVDFVVYGESEFLAIEVKHSDQFDRKSLKALTEFKSDYPESRCLFVYRGKERFEREGVLVLPAEDFLKSLDPSLSISRIYQQKN